MREDRVFDILFLIGRPAAGKSEVIDFLKHLDPEVRSRKYHIGEFREIDDFPLLWAWFEEDRILSDLGLPRLHSDEEGYFLDREFWNVLIRRLELEYKKVSRDNPGFGKERTALIEFSRGSEHGGFQTAFNHFSPDLLRRGAAVYIDVPFEESLRKNRNRKNPDRLDSILQHSLEDEKLERLYRDSDWLSFSGTDPDYLHIASSRVPYRVLDNRDDVTSSPDARDELARRLRETCDSLWKLYSVDR